MFRHSSRNGAKFDPRTGLDFSASIELIQNLRSPIVYNDFENTEEYISKCLGEFYSVFFNNFVKQYKFERNLINFVFYALTQSHV